MTKYGFIYGLICPITNETVYVGKTTNSIEYRLKTHISKTKTKIKYNKRLSKKEVWIKKLILLEIEDKITVYLIEVCEEDKINEREIFWISEYMTHSRLKNLTIGGDGGQGYKHTLDTIIKISNNRVGKCLGKDHPNYNKKIGQEEWFKLSSLMKSSNNPNIGKPCKQQTKDKISLSNSGEKNGMYGKTFSMSSEHKDKISYALLNSEQLKKSRNSEEFKKKISDIFSIPILLLDLDFNTIEEFKNLRECSEKLGCTKGNVKNAITDLRKICRKYWVVRKEEYIESIQKIRDKSLFY